MKYITLPSAPSTNATAAAMDAVETPHGTVVSVHTQTAGRGQRGNSWESEPGKNLTFSLVLRPSGWHVTRQFELSMVVSVALASALREMESSLDVKVKWPNDLYVGNGKLCGMLIENTLEAGQPYISRSIVGVGLNVNQERFLSKAPNPVSMKILTGKTYPLEPMLKHLCERTVCAVDSYMAHMDGADAVKGLTRLYHSLLWRKDGKMHRWMDASTLRMFDARLECVHPDGTLQLYTDSGLSPCFAFKEVAAVLQG